VALIAKEAQTYIDRGWMMQNDSMLTLSQEGRLYADRIASDLFVMENDFK
jgi:coproporphyrinogen III oxidase-like Fe-S oxidoreductase